MKVSQIKLPELQYSAALKAVEGFLLGIVLDILPHLNAIVAGQYSVSWTSIVTSALIGAILVGLSRLFLLNDKNLSTVFAVMGQTSEKTIEAELNGAQAAAENRAPTPNNEASK